MNDIFKIVLCSATFWFSGMILFRIFFHAMFQRGIVAEDSRRYTSPNSEVVVRSFLNREQISSNQVVSTKVVTSTNVSATAATPSTTIDETRITTKHDSTSI